VSCQDRPWGEACLATLVDAIDANDSQAMASWIGVHLNPAEGALPWGDLARDLACLVASYLEDSIPPGSLDDGSIFMPVAEGANRVETVAVQMVAMVLNSDRDGIQGLLAALAFTDELGELCAVLALMLRDTKLLAVLRGTA
jgi:hypothetical protein